MPSFGKSKPHKYVPFGYKLMITYMVFIILPVIAIGYFSHSMYQDSIRQQTRNNIQGTLIQMKDNIEYKLKDVDRISAMLYGDYSLITQLRHFEKGWESYERTTKILKPKFSIAVNSTGLNIAMYLFLANETLPEVYYGSLDNERPDELEGNYNIYHLKRIEDKPWHSGFPPEQFGETKLWQRVERDMEFGRISLLRRLVDFEKPLELKEIGFMRISVRTEELFQAVDYSKIGNGSALVIKDEYGRVLYQSGTVPITSNESHPGAEYLTIQESVGDQSWQLAAYVPMTVMEQDSKKVRVFIILICFFCLVIFTFAGMFISRYFSTRMNKIVFVLNAFREGDLRKRMGYRGKDEFSQIASALNEMGRNIDQLIEQVYVTQIEKKEAELESLQAQINPHFLYNTLSSISRLAQFGEVDKLQRMVLDLAKFYRLSLNEGRTVIPIRSELEQVQAYMNIQTTKFGDSVSIFYDIEPEIINYVTVKLILQPFIENALEHAWFGNSIHIRVSGKREGANIVFKIIDDGIGMSEELIRQIFDPVEGLNTGYGIRNVNSRIQLHFGTQYGVTIGSRPGIGTTIQIVIPAER
ncbi:two-component system sensor histidine kinase YesM [Fontibacillus phaseoli]|uniref:histidine kinase n=1 Tax=Fontibacillus phaseoli TaxID=1416533 RepID=A0A369BGE4_9BACL|nr:sensor histidine kinase [Fontibacillus phaseoli]RCX20481.1 two-component system sensor histidine kinase YesM [Fontibacillus phaseoli]